MTDQKADRAKRLTGIFTEMIIKLDHGPLSNKKEMML